ncbi:hypothetical protein [Thioalkalivibrio nitratireducens]|uniref:hypothetical protein n=1 Tax=Thioalkalivibrio nitratireducens TaxID=186931 RepID=UPI0005C200F6|nr:hypothetical protein [Thioalkalivibrio nitratireducens]
MDTTVCARELAFRGPHREADQAPAAALLLSNSPVVQEVAVTGPNRVLVRYDLREVTFAEIESALEELGFHLDNSVLTRLRRAYYEYCEDTRRANLKVRSNCFGHCARRIFVREYQKHEHGCRDQRPEHWRAYW